MARLTDGFWKAFARCLDMPELIADPRFAEYGRRLENRDALELLIEARMRQEETAFWLDRLDTFDVPNAPIPDVGEALAQPHVVARGLVETVRHVEAGDMRLVRGPIRFDGAGAAPSTPPPLLGEHSVEVLTRRLGFDEAECRRLIEENVTAVPQTIHAAE